MSHIILLVGIALLVLLARARRRQRALARPPIIVPIEDDDEAVSSSLAQPAMPWQPAPAPAIVAEPVEIRQASVPVTAGPARPGVRKYLLDGAEPRQGRIDRIAGIERSIRGRGLCSPRS